MSDRVAPENFFAIPRHAFYADDLVNPPALPMALSDFFNPDAPRFSKPTAPGISSPIEYFIIPAAGATGWNGIDPLNRLLNTVDNKTLTEPPLNRNFSTLTFSAHRGGKRDETTIAQLGHAAFQRVKNIAGDRIKEVNSLGELMQLRTVSAYRTPPH